MKIKTTLATVSFLTLMAVSVPALADTNVLCSVRANSQNVAGAAYTPGVDAKGRAVVPADTSKPVMGVPKSLTIPLTVDLAQRMNEVLPAGSKLEGKMGLVEVMADGQVLINGKDMTGPADTMCSTIAKQKAAALKTADAPKAAHHPKKKKMPAKPVEAVTSEPVAAPAPEAAATPAAPAPTPPEAPKPEAAPAPQVLDAKPPEMPPAAAPVPQPAPIATPTPPGVPAAPTTPPAPGATAAPTPPPSGAVVSPVEATGTPPAPPLDPLSPPPAAPTPAPAPGANGTLSGGAQ